jgi:hypothetical protein
MKATWVRSSPGSESRLALMPAHTAPSMPQEAAAIETSMMKT